MNRSLEIKSRELFLIIEIYQIKITVFLIAFRRTFIGKPIGFHNGKTNILLNDIQNRKTKEINPIKYINDTNKYQIKIY